MALAAEMLRTRALVFDEARIGAGCRPPLPGGEARRCVEFLVQHGLARLEAPRPEVPLRLLAGSLRLACELPSLGATAQSVLAAIRDGDPGAWSSVSAEGLGVSPPALARALDELESRQLVFADRPPPRVMIDGGRRWERRLDEALGQLMSLRTAERAKLDAVVAYATTKRCRRDFILRYFGDVAERSACGRCDNCR
jgi:ATP-dependent DNA helicase RecQ